MNGEHNNKAGHQTGTEMAEAYPGVDAHSVHACRSLRCPLHVWICDLNGDLKADSAASARLAEKGRPTRVRT